MSKNPWFVSDDFNFIYLGGMRIPNDRNKSGSVYLAIKNWSGMLQGIDGYPKTNKLDDYYIAGG